MVSPRWRKVLRDLWSNKTRTALVVLSIAVGVFAVGMIGSSRMILSEELSTTYLETDPPSAILYGAFDHETVRMVERMDGIAAAEGRSTLGLRVFAGERWHDLQLTAIRDFNDIRVSRFRSVSGAWPPDDRELLVERASLDALGAAVGESVLLETRDGRQRTARVAGAVHDLGQPSALFDPTLKGYITFDTLEWLGGSETYSQLRILVSDRRTDEGHIQQVADSVQAKIEKGGESVSWTRIPAPGKHWADDVAQSMMTILGVLGFLSLGLSGFLVVNTISALLTQQTRQIGVMKTIGASRGQLVRMYLGAVLIFGLLSLLVAVPLGGIAAHAFVNFATSMLNFYDIPFQIPRDALLLEIGVGLVVPLLAALWPIFSGTRVTVQEAISATGLGATHFGSNWFDRLIERVRGLPRPLLLSLRNTFRKKGRLILTLSTLILGGAIFIAVLSVHASLMATLDDALAYWAYNLDVTFARDYRIEQIEREALGVPGVVAAESWLGAGARRVRADGRESPDIQIIAPPAQTTMLQPTLLKGRWLLPEDENALVINSIVLDEDPDIEVGDEITLQIDGRDSTWRVVGLAQGVLSGPIAYANYPYFAEVLRFVGRATSVQIVTERSDIAFEEGVTEALKSRFEQAGINVTRADTTASLRENITGQFNILVAFLAIMAVLIAVVGGLGLTGTMSINVLERSREIGVMRAIGASDGSVVSIFMVEGMLIGAISWIAGAILALPISRMLSDVVGIQFMDGPLVFTYSIPGALLWLAVVLALAALATFLPAWRASRLTVRDVLAYE